MLLWIVGCKLSFFISLFLSTVLRLLKMLNISLQTRKTFILKLLRTQSRMKHGRAHVGACCADIQIDQNAGNVEYYFILHFFLNSLIAVDGTAQWGQLCAFHKQFTKKKEYILYYIYVCVCVCCMYVHTTHICAF